MALSNLNPQEASEEPKQVLKLGPDGKLHIVNAPSGETPPSTPGRGVLRIGPDGKPQIISRAQQEEQGFMSKMGGFFNKWMTQVGQGYSPIGSQLDPEQLPAAAREIGGEIQAVREEALVPITKRVTGYSATEAVQAGFERQRAIRQLSPQEQLQADPVRSMGMLVKTGRMPKQETAIEQEGSRMVEDTLSTAAAFVDFLTSPEGVLVGLITTAYPPAGVAILGGYAVESGVHASDALDKLARSQGVELTSIRGKEDFLKIFDNPDPDLLQEFLMAAGLTSLLTGGAPKAPKLAREFKERIAEGWEKYFEENVPPVPLLLEQLKEQKAGAPPPEVYTSAQVQGMELLNKLPKNIDTNALEQQLNKEDAYYRERLENPALIGQAEVIQVQGETRLAVPTGGKRKAGLLQSVGDEAAAQKIEGELLGKPGFKDVRIELNPENNSYDVLWGEPLIKDAPLAMGQQFGYSRAEIDKFRSSYYGDNPISLMTLDEAYDRKLHPKAYDDLSVGTELDARIRELRGEEVPVKPRPKTAKDVSEMTKTVIADEAAKLQEQPVEPLVDAAVAAVEGVRAIEAAPTQGRFRAKLEAAKRKAKTAAGDLKRRLGGRAIEVLQERRDALQKNIRDIRDALNLSESHALAREGLKSAKGRKLPFDVKAAAHEKLGDKFEILDTYRTVQEGTQRAAVEAARAEIKEKLREMGFPEMGYSALLPGESFPGEGIMRQRFPTENHAYIASLLKAVTKPVVKSRRLKLIRKGGGPLTLAGQREIFGKQLRKKLTLAELEERVTEFERQEAQLSEVASYLEVKRKRGIKTEPVEPEVEVKGGISKETERIAFEEVTEPRPSGHEISDVSTEEMARTARGEVNYEVTKGGVATWRGGAVDVAEGNVLVTVNAATGEPFITAPVPGVNSATALRAAKKAFDTAQKLRKVVSPAPKMAKGKKVKAAAQDPRHTATSTPPAERRPMERPASTGSESPRSFNDAYSAATTGSFVDAKGDVHTFDITKYNDVRLVHGIADIPDVQGFAARKPHAWVEMKDAKGTAMVWDPSRRKTFKAPAFSRLAKPETRFVFTPEEAARLTEQHGKTGPFSAEERGQVGATAAERPKGPKIFDIPGREGERGGFRIGKGWSREAAGKEKSPIFYSHIERTIETRMPPRASAESIAALLHNSGANLAELKWIDLDGWLQQKRAQGLPVEKAELQEFLRRNRLEVTETTKIKVPLPKEYEKIKAEIAELRVSNDQIVSKLRSQTEATRSEVLSAARFHARRTQPGIPSLSELIPEGIERALLDLPAFKQLIQNITKDRALDLQKDRFRDQVQALEAEGGHPQYERYTLPGGENYREVLLQLPITEKQAAFNLIEPRANIEDAPALRSGLATGRYERTYRGPHFDEPNIVAHVRLKDRVDTQGRRTLFIEELQSDWAKELRDTDIVSQSLEGQIPDMPFTRDWHKLALKRVLRMAAEEGYDQIAWTTGRQQMRRYGLTEGESHLRLYDQMVPQFLSRYGKKWGAKVEGVAIPDLGGTRSHVSGMRITPDMKRSVLEGQRVQGGFAKKGKDALTELAKAAKKKLAPKKPVAERPSKERLEILHSYFERYKTDADPRLLDQHLPGVLQKLMKPEELKNFSNYLRTNIDQIAQMDAAVEFLKDPSKRRVYLALADAMQDPKFLQFEGGQAFSRRLTDLGTNLQEYRAWMQHTASQAGSTLRYFGVLKDILMKKGVDLGDAKLPSWYDKGIDALRKTDDVRRAAMISQMATAVRNAIVQVPVFGTKLLTETIAGVADRASRKLFFGDLFDVIDKKGKLVQGMLTREQAEHITKQNKSYRSVIAEESLSQTFAHSIELVSSLRRSLGQTLKHPWLNQKSTAQLELFSPESRFVLEQFPKAVDSLFAFVDPDVRTAGTMKKTMGTIVRGLTFFNRWQEFIFRRTFADAAIRAELTRRKININELDKIPKARLAELVEEAVHAGLQLTFADGPSSSVGKALLEFWDKARPITTFFHPFVRFAMNSAKYVGRHSPARGISPKHYAMLHEWMTSGNPNDMLLASRMLAESATGTMLVTMGYMLASSEYGGPVWYNLYDPETKRPFFDARPFQPFALYLWFGHLLRRGREAAELSQERDMQLRGNPEDDAVKFGTRWLYHTLGSLTAGDTLEALTSLNRLSGSGLIFIELLLQGDKILPDDPVERGAELENLTKEVAGSYLGSFTVPLKQLKDIFAIFNPDDRLFQTARTDPFIGNLVRNLPTDVPPGSPEWLRYVIPTQKGLIGRQLPQSPSPTEGLAKPLLPILGIPGTTFRQLPPVGPLFQQRERDILRYEIDRLVRDREAEYRSFFPAKTGNRVIDYAKVRYFGEYMNEMARYAVDDPSFASSSGEERADIIMMYARQAKVHATIEAFLTINEARDKQGLDLIPFNFFEGRAQAREFKELGITYEDPTTTEQILPEE